MSIDAPWPASATWHDLRRGERRLRFVADERRRVEIAGRLELEAVRRLEAEITVAPWLDGIEIGGTVRAVVTRICGVSLEPFDETIDEPVQVRLVPEGSPNAPGRDAALLVVSADEADPPEETPGESIDLGGLVVEYLALGLSPFPRKPGVAFEPPAEQGSSLPFAALAALKRTDDGG